MTDVKVKPEDEQAAEWVVAHAAGDARDIIKARAARAIANARDEERQAVARAMTDAQIADADRIAADSDSLPVGVSREICRICYQVNAVGFSVPDDVWQSVVPPALQNYVLCLACFTRLADQKLIPWDRRITFYPVSLFSHISPSIAAALGRSDERRIEEAAR